MSDSEHNLRLDDMRVEGRLGSWACTEYLKLDVSPRFPMDDLFESEINRYGAKRVLSSAAAAHSKDNDGAKFDNLGALTTGTLYVKKFDESVTAVEPLTIQYGYTGSG